MEENKAEIGEGRVQAKISLNKNNLLNYCVLGFVALMTFIGLITFLVAVGKDENNNASLIINLYVLCMLLAAPTLKVFFDKAVCPLMKRLNVIGLVTIFAAILIMGLVTFITLASENGFIF